MLKWAVINLWKARLVFTVVFTDLNTVFPLFGALLSQVRDIYIRLPQTFAVSVYSQNGQKWNKK